MPNSSEAGFVRVPNEFLEALCRLRIPGEARQVFDFILRKTWGWGKHDDRISLSQIVLGTGLQKPKIIRARQKLQAMNLIVIPHKGNGPSISYSINKGFDSWKPFPKRATFPKKGTVIPLKGNKTFPKKGPTIDNKDTKQKTLFLSDSIEIRLSELLLNLIRQRRPQFKAPNLQNWAKQIDLLIRMDEIPSSEVEETIQAVQRDPFWQNNILSTSKLRDKYDQLRLKLFPCGKAKDLPDLASLRETIGGAL